MEGKSAFGLHVRYPEVSAAIEYLQYSSLLEDLQRVHDNKDVKDWPQALNDVAIKHGLEP